MDDHPCGYKRCGCRVVGLGAFCAAECEREAENESRMESACMCGHTACTPSHIRRNQDLMTSAAANIEDELTVDDGVSTPQRGGTSS